MDAPPPSQPAAALLPALLAPDLAPLFWRPARLGFDSAWTAHLPFAHWIVCAARPRRLVELGTHNGVSYTGFCEAVVQGRLATQCYAVDTWQGDAHTGEYDRAVYDNLRKFHDQYYGTFSQLLRCTFDEALPTMPDGGIDLLHIDGWHTYEAVRHDFDSWLPKLSARAVVLLHDANVRDGDFGVFKLVAELREHYPVFEFLHESGLAVVAVGRDAPADVRALCALDDPAAIAAIRERFSQLGERWRFEVHLRLLIEEIERSRTQLNEVTARAAEESTHLRGVIDQHFQDVFDARNEVTRLTAEVASLRHMEAELARSQAEAEWLVADVQQLRTRVADTEKMRAEVDDARRAAARAAERTADVRRSAAAAYADLDGLTAALEAARSEAAEWHAVAASAQADSERHAAESLAFEAVRQDRKRAHELAIQSQEQAREARNIAARAAQRAEDSRRAASAALAEVDRLRHEATLAIEERNHWAEEHFRAATALADALQTPSRARPSLRAAAGPVKAAREAAMFAVRVAWWTLRLRLRQSLRAHAEFRADLALIRGSKLYDAAWYLSQNPDIAAAGVDPTVHYLRFGATEKRNPSPAFDAVRYLDANPDVVQSGINPLLHYLRYGAIERRTVWPVAGAAGRASDPAVAPVRPPLRQPNLTAAPSAEPAPGLVLASAVAGSAGLRLVYFEGETGTPGSQYRVARPAEAARRCGASVASFPIDEAPVRREEIVGADIVVIWRAAWSPGVVAAIQTARQAGVPVVFDCDDLMIEPDIATVELIDGIRTQFIPVEAVRDHYGRVRDTMANSDACIASTDELAVYMRRHAKTTFVLPNGFDAAVWRASRAAVRRRRQSGGDGLVRLGYAAGSRTHQKDFATIAAPLARLLRDCPQCRLVLFSSPVDRLPVLDIAEFAEFAGLESQIEWRMMVPLAHLPQEMARFDINLAPLEVGNPFCEAKSELKYFEAALVDVPTIASPTGPFRRAIADGQTGCLAGTEEAWYAGLRGLVDDATLRHGLARAAYRDALWRYGPERRVEAMAAILAQLRGGPEAARAFALEAARAMRPRRDPLVPPSRVLFERDSLTEADVTVIVPLYNYEQHVTEALDSVAAQTLTALHLVIVDDASTDRSRAVALDWAERHASRFGRIVVLGHVANSGLGPARNSGFDAAETPYVLPLDADNRLRPGCCAALLEAAKTSGAAFVYPVIQEFGDTTALMGTLPYAPQRLVGVPYIDAMALVSAAAWAAAGGYWDGRLGWEDYEFWCKLAEYGLNGRQVPGEPLAEYRVHRGSMLRSVTETARNKARVMADITQAHPWLSLIYASDPPKPD